MDPRTVIEQWTDMWNAGDLGRAPLLVADPCLRHEAGELVAKSLADNLTRITQTRARFSNLDIRNVLLTVDGEYVTSCYEFAFDNETTAEREVLAGIEVFRVQGGRITETWNAPPGRGHWG